MRHDLSEDQTLIRVKHPPIGPGTNPITKNERPRVTTSVETWYSFAINRNAGLKTEDAKVEHTG
jgi:hypothetical protein